MRLVREAPGVFYVEMTDDERREAYRVSPSVVAAIRNAKKTGDIEAVRAALGQPGRDALEESIAALEAIRGYVENVDSDEDAAQVALTVYCFARDALARMGRDDNWTPTMPEGSYIA